VKYTVPKNLDKTGHF